MPRRRPRRRLSSGYSLKRPPLCLQQPSRVAATIHSEHVHSTVSLILTDDGRESQSVRRGQRLPEPLPWTNSHPLRFSPALRGGQRRRHSARGLIARGWTPPEPHICAICWPAWPATWWHTNKSLGPGFQTPKSARRAPELDSGCWRYEHGSETKEASNWYALVLYCHGWLVAKSLH